MDPDNDPIQNEAAGAPAVPMTEEEPQGMHTPRDDAASPGSTRIGTPRSPFGGSQSPYGTPSSHRGTPSRRFTQRGDLGGGAGPQRRRRSSSQATTPAESPRRSEEEPALGGSGMQGAPPIPTTDEMGTQEVEETFVWGTNVSVQDVTEKFRRFMRNFRESEEEEGDPKYVRLVDELVEREGDTLNIDCANVAAFNPELYSLLVRYPLEVVPLFDLVVVEMAQERDAEWGKHVQVRPFNLLDTVHMRDLNPSDVDQLVSVRGMIIRSSGIIPDIRAAFFKCLVCGHAPEQVFVDRGRIQEPARCPRPECAARGSMALIHNRSRFINKQIVRLQETPESIPEGETPHTVSMCVFDALVDAAKPGDRVEVTGVFRAIPVRLNSKDRTLKSLYKTYLDCIHLKKQHRARMTAEDPLQTDKDAETFASFHEGDTLPEQLNEQIDRLKELSRLPDIYERLASSLAPSIYELEDAKKGLLCQLFGGSIKKLASSGTQLRGDINVLLVGDPGTSKSQLLQYVHKISPRGIYTSGRGSSAVGLTAYVTRDPETREMVLESGALVLSDRGICCIDEFDKMSDNARSTLHEVMEQQTVSVAKAGIIATLNARTSVCACANPSGSRYNPRLSVIDNIQLPPTLLSRFDLIYLILDKADETTDRRLARHLIALHYEQQEARQTETLDVATLSAYISYARNNIHPELSDAAAEALVETYAQLRGRGGGRKVITATPRQLESLIRLSEALARMRLSGTVEASDVAEARRLLQVAMQQSATDPNTGTIDMDLITTGISASERTKKAQIQAAVLAFVQDKSAEGRAGSGSFRAVQIWEEMKRNTAMELGLQEVREALTKLHAEGKVKFQGDAARLT